jgi:hypothetical protein
MDYQRQLSMILEEKERERREKHTHAKGVIAQENPICFLSLTMIAFHQKHYPQVTKYCELLFKTNDLEKEVSIIPLLTFQKVVSILIRFQKFDLAQLITTKFILSFPINYALGYYILFLLAIKNRDENAIIGSWRKFDQVYYHPESSVSGQCSKDNKMLTTFEPMKVYWPFMLSKIVRLPIPKL